MQAALDGAGLLVETNGDFLDRQLLKVAKENDFEIVRDAQGQKQLREIREGRIAGRDCTHRVATLGGRTDRCWE